MTIDLTDDKTLEGLLAAAAVAVTALGAGAAMLSGSRTRRRRQLRELLGALAEADGGVGSRAHVRAARAWRRVKGVPHRRKLDLIRSGFPGEPVRSARQVSRALRDRGQVRR